MLTFCPQLMLQVEGIAVPTKPQLMVGGECHPTFCSFILQYLWAIIFSGSDIQSYILGGRERESRKVDGDGFFHVMFLAQMSIPRSPSIDAFQNVNEMLVLVIARCSFGQPILHWRLCMSQSSRTACHQISIYFLLLATV